LPARCKRPDAGENFARPRRFHRARPLGNYYAEKIRERRACPVRPHLRPERREAAIAHLQTALDHWKRYATAYTAQYEQPKLYNRVGWVDIPALVAKVEQDIAIARLWTPGTVPDKPAVRHADVPFRNSPC
jgi:hypothetical protein